MRNGGTVRNASPNHYTGPHRGFSEKVLGSSRHRSMG